MTKYRLRAAAFVIVIAGAAALDMGVLASLVPKAQQAALTSTEAERIIRDGLQHRLRGARHDAWEVSVSACRIQVFRHDDDVRGQPTTITTKEEFVDLRVLEATDSSMHAIIGHSGPTVNVRFVPRPGIGDETSYLEGYDERLLAEARAEIGWGWQAAVLASDRLLQDYPLESLALWRRATQCSGDSWVPANSVSLWAGGPEMADTARIETAFLAYSAHCANR
jgi:hypothetical protein